MSTDGIKDAAGVFSSLASGGYSVKLRGFSAIDAYLGLNPLPFLRAETNADITVLARLFENLRFPGVETADAAVDVSDGVCYFHCIDSDDIKKKQFSFPLLSFGYDLPGRRFEDPLEVYAELRKIRSILSHPAETFRRSPNEPGSKNKRLSAGKHEPGAEPDVYTAVVHGEPNKYRIILEGALILARYGFSGIRPQYPMKAGEVRHNSPLDILPCPEIQRVFLSGILISSRPEIGLELIKSSGLLDELWPELACMDDVDQSKEFHPEGNLWKHTLETFRYRKAGVNGSHDLRLSLGLLLHDAGKPISAASGNHRFEGHAELGAKAAARFLERLEFEPSLVNDIYYLVRNHMLPAALKRLPLAKTGEIMSSPLFTTLMELYRCDESSSFKGLDDFYENSAAYQSFLKNLRNPYRSADGKKIGKKEMFFSHRQYR